MRVVDLEPYWCIKHLKVVRHKMRNIGDRIFSKLYDVSKNHCNLSAHFLNLLTESWINR